MNFDVIMTKTSI